VTLYRLRGTILNSRATMSGEDEPPRAQVLILLLSKSNLDLGPWDPALHRFSGPAGAAIEEARQWLWQNQKRDRLLAVLACPNWPVESQPWSGQWGPRPAARWNWQQQLRAIRPHGHHLREVVVIGSDGDGSHRQFEAFKRLLTPALPRREPRNNWPACRIVPYSHGVNFESYDDVHDAVCDAIDETTRRWGIGTSDVCVDVTGGMATTSIAAAVAAINRGARFSYVQTLHPNRVKFYRASIEGLQV
jgi:hypothetical protein